MREALLTEITGFRHETGLSETYLGKRAGVGTGFFDRVRAGTASVNSIEKFRAFAVRWREGKQEDGAARPQPRRTA